MFYNPSQQQENSLEIARSNEADIARRAEERRQIDDAKKPSRIAGLASTLGTPKLGDRCRPAIRSPLVPGTESCRRRIDRLRAVDFAWCGNVE